MDFFKKTRSLTLPHPSLTELINAGDIEALTGVLNELSPFELAELISKKADEDRTIIFRSLPQSIALQTFDFLPTRLQRQLLKTMPTMQAAYLLKELSPDDRTTFLQDLPQELIDELIKLLPYEERIETLNLLGYPKGSIGRLMTTDYLAVKMDWSIEQVLDHVQKYGHDSETIDYIYVVDQDGKLLDDIKLRDLLFVSRQSKIETICNKKFIVLSINESDKSAINVFREYNRNALPVIDEKGVLRGIVTIDDILRLANQEATKEIQKIGGTEALNEPYLLAPLLELIRKRAGWLVILFLGEMFTATAMGFFEEEIAKAVVLALFLPLIISSGGNAGSQASTLVIRAMALGEVKLIDWFKVLRREIFSGICLGVILGLIGFFRVSIWSMFSDIYGPHWLLVAITIFFALICVVLWGTLIGGILPLLLRKIGVDPATSSAPFVATIVDVTGLIIYFLIALYTLKGTLL